MHSFNSQRDGILHCSQPIWGREFRFQFPTGWNSTQQIAYAHSAHLRFQFPTGWNSTNGCLVAEGGFEFQFPTGWNSTRSYRDCNVFSYGFQFPTGWNSTSKYAPCIFRRASFNSQRDGILREIELTAPLLWSSFNSQRDGILHRWRRCLLDKLLFQFPTGWNSTRFWFLLPQIPRHVSIPNGMEFYPLSPLLAFAYFASFNSQRDGILL